MRPLEVSLENALEVVPDWRRRELGVMGRLWAEGGSRPELGSVGTYWDRAVLVHEWVVLLDAYYRRVERLRRVG